MTTLSSNQRLARKAVGRYIFPSVAALLGTRVSSIINSILLGNMLGGDGLAVMSLVLPIDIAFMSIGALIGVGASIVGGLALGAGSKERYHDAYSAGIETGLLLGVVISALGCIFAGPLAGFLGAKGNILALTSDYLRFYFLGGVFLILMYVPLNFLRLAGEPGAAMSMLLLMSGVNTTASLGFGLLCHMGAAGVALGTATAYALTCVYGFFRIEKTKSVRFVYHLPKRREVLLQISEGSPAALNNICMAIQIAVMNLLITGFGYAGFLPAYSVMNTVGQVMISFTVGIPQAALPLVVMSYGERDFAAIKIVVRQVVLIGNVVLAACTVLLIAAKDTLPNLFGITGGQLLAQTSLALLFLSLSLNMQFMCNFGLNYYQATHRKSISNLIIVLRSLVFMLIPAALLLGFCGISQFWLTYIIAEFATITCVLGTVVWISWRNRSLSKVLLLDSDLQRNMRFIDFSVENNPKAIVAASAKIADFCDEAEMNPKQAMAVSMAIEEILVLVGEKALKHSESTIDLRITKTDGQVLMRIRNGGKRYNPLDLREDNDDYLGLAMIEKMTKNIDYNRAFGVNNLVIEV